VTRLKLQVQRAQLAELMGNDNIDGEATDTKAAQVAQAAAAVEEERAASDEPRTTFEPDDLVAKLKLIRWSPNVRCVNLDAIVDDVLLC
jgi:hypothetical protein